MLKTQGKRLAGLEQRLEERIERQVDWWHDAIWAQFSPAEADAVQAALDRVGRPGYAPTAEDTAIEQRWNEAVQAVVPTAKQRALQWARWAVRWCEAVRVG